MKRRNEEAVVRALFPFGQQHVDKLRDRKGVTSDEWQEILLTKQKEMAFFYYICMKWTVILIINLKNQKLWQNKKRKKQKYCPMQKN